MSNRAKGDVPVRGAADSANLRRNPQLTQSQKHSALAWLFREVISRCQTILASVMLALLLLVFFFPNSFSFSTNVSVGTHPALPEKVDGQSPSGVIIPITP